MAHRRVALAGRDDVARNIQGAVQGQGTCIAVAEDDDLVEWRELPQTPVIPLHREGDEYVAPSAVSRLLSDAAVDSTLA